MNFHKILFPKKEAYIEDLKKSNNGFAREAILSKENLENLYNENKDFFQDMLVREFVGYVPKEINEPTLKFFSDNAAMFQKWVLWQSHYINRKAMHDPLKLPRYEGMMIYLKVLHTIASANKSVVSPDAPPEKEQPKEVPVIEKELEALSAFKDGLKPKEK